MDIAEAKIFLSGNGWLADTPAEFRETILGRCKFRRFDKLQNLYHIGDEPGGLWGLASGTLQIEFSDESRAPIFIHQAVPGFWTGEASVITGRPRVIGMKASRAAELLYLSRPAFIQITETDPQAWRWLALLSLQHTLDTLEKLYDLTIPNAERRVVSVLLRMVGRYGSRDVTTDPDLPDVDIGQDTLANTCNVSRAALAEIIRNLSSDGLIRTGYRKISVIDPVRLLQRVEAAD